MKTPLVFLLYIGFRIIYFIKNNNDTNTSKPMYVLAWFEFGLIGSLLASRFLGNYSYWVAIPVAFLFAGIGYFLTTRQTPEKKEWEEEIEEIGDDSK